MGVRSEVRGVPSLALTFSFDVMGVANDSSFWHCGVASLHRTIKRQNKKAKYVGGRTRDCKLQPPIWDQHGLRSPLHPQSLQSPVCGHWCWWHRPSAPWSGNSLPQFGELHLQWSSSLYHSEGIQSQYLWTRTQRGSCTSRRDIRVSMSHPCSIEESYEALSSADILSAGPPCNAT